MTRSSEISLHPLMSAGWREQRFERLSAIDTGAGSVTVEYVVESEASNRYVHHQVYEEGRLLAWNEGAHGDPDVRLAQPLEHATAFLTAHGDPLAALEATRILTERRGALTRCRVPPLDERDAPGMASLPRVPWATVALRLVLTDSPFGHLSFIQHFDEGRRSGFTFDDGDGPESDGVGIMTYDAYVRYRCGDLSLIEALEGEDPGGPWARLMLAAGLIDGPEYWIALDAEAAPARERRALGTLGEIVSSPNYVAALVALESQGAQRS